MNIEELRDQAFKMVALQYEQASDAEFDIMPVVFGIQPDDTMVLCVLHGAPPHEMLPAMIKQFDLQAFVFACPSWVRKPEESDDARTEAIIYSIETPTHSEMWSQPLTRTPMPELGALKQATSVKGRMTHLLHQHTRN